MGVDRIGPLTMYTALFSVSSFTACTSMRTVAFLPTNRLGILKIPILGGLDLVPLIDFIVLLTGNFTDKNGNKITT
jgi:hypothetical protein